MQVMHTPWQYSKCHDYNIAIQQSHDGYNMAKQESHDGYNMSIQESRGYHMTNKILMATTWLSYGITVEVTAITWQYSKVMMPLARAT